MSGKKKLTPIKAIRQKCIDCSAGMLSHIKNCPCVDCSLYPYRMGRRPKKSELTKGFLRNKANLKGDKNGR